MTLVEIIITLAIIGMASALAVPAIGSLTHANLNQSARTLAQKVREGYTMASLDGGAWRLVLTPGSDQVTCERSDSELRLDGGRAVSLGEDWARLRQAAGLTDDKDIDSAAATGLAALMGQSLADDPAAAAAAAAAAEGQRGSDKAKAALPEGQGFAAAEVRPLKLAGNTKILDVWTEGMSAPVLEGSVYLYFFPQGYTQSALIHLQDSGRKVMTVRVHALTGKCDILTGYTEVAK